MAASPVAALLFLSIASTASFASSRACIFTKTVATRWFWALSPPVSLLVLATRWSAGSSSSCRRLLRVILVASSSFRTDRKALRYDSLFLPAAGMRTSNRPFFSGVHSSDARPLGSIRFLRISITRRTVVFGSRSPRSFISKTMLYPPAISWPRGKPLPNRLIPHSSTRTATNPNFHKNEVPFIFINPFPCGSQGEPVARDARGVYIPTAGSAEIVSILNRRLWSFPPKKSRERCGSAGGRGEETSENWKGLLARGLLQQDQLLLVEGVVVDQLVLLTESVQRFESLGRVHAR